MTSNPYQQYRHNAVATATPEELTLMLYNGAIKFCHMTIEAIEKKDTQKANESNQKVQAIIVELRATLDDRFEIAKQMDRLYEFIISLMIEANIKKDKNKVEEALKLIREFRDTWQEVIKLNKNQPEQKHG